MQAPSSFDSSGAAHRAIRNPFASHIARALTHDVFTRSGNSTALQEEAKSSTTSTFLTSLWVNAAVFGAEILAFTLLCKVFIDVYLPRVSDYWLERRRAPKMKSFWLVELLRVDDRKIKDINGLDAYMFVRFLRMMLYIFVPIWVISWLILLPVDSIGNDTGNSGLDLFTFGNVATANSNRYWAHLLCAWAFTMWIGFVIRREMRNFLGERQKYLTSQEHYNTPQAKTILITGVPLPDLVPSRLMHYFDVLPGGVKRIWVNRNLGELPDVYDRRMKACKDLEKMETKLIHTAVKIRTKETKDGEKAEKAHARASKKGAAANPPSSSGVTRTSESTSTKPFTHSGSRSDLSTSSSDSSIRRREASNSSDPTDSSRAREMTGSTDATPYSTEPKSTSGIESSDYRGKSDTSYDTDLERGEALTLAEKLVPADQRPMKSLPFWKFPFAVPFLSKKTDGITWCRNEIHETTEILETERAELRKEIGDENAHVGGAAGLGRRGAEILGKAMRKKQKASVTMERKKEQETKYPALNSVFIMFNKQIAAHLAVQTLAHHKPYAMTERYIEVAPGDVIWGNLGLDPREMRIRALISYAITVGLIILWSIPVTFIGAISNISTLCTTYDWLAWLCEIDGTVLGLIEGVLPTVLLAALMAILPIFLRLLARFEGRPTRSSLELSLMTRYFCFQIIHSFLIVTLSSGLIAALPGLISNPTSIPSLLASSLPEASNFFLTYVILQGLSGSGAGFLQYVTFGKYYVKRILFGVTPRSVYTLSQVKWGTLFPSTTLIAVIAIAYMVISPIINGLAVLTFYMFYQLYRYIFVWCDEQSDDQETGGLFFPRAISHVFAGMYIQQICLATLFFLARDTDDKASAIPQGALMIVLIFFTGVYNHSVFSSYGPLCEALPLTRAVETYHRDDEREALLDRDEYPNDNDLVRTDTIDSYETHDDRVRRTFSTNRSHREVAMGGQNDKEKKLDLENYYVHPARGQPQRTIWIPRDDLGLGEAEVQANKGAGISASCENARMDMKGNVTVHGQPPGNDAEEEETS